MMTAVRRGRMTGSELKMLRLARGLSRAALAAEAGMHPDSVKYWETKAQVNLRGCAPARIVKALGWEAPRLVEVGNFPTKLRARHGLLAFTKGTSGKCGARTRKGTPCRCKPIPGKKRCKLHGGLSTGPKTPEGRERIAEAQLRRWAAWRAAFGGVRV
ncbi:helix-turn-helix transcriptional regulator [Cypionkella sp.]|uniref:helix-turn-helix transcriptional regulator n=1 Tax=Cypionkella sp. TaxID=2811411 RepID=UPI002FDDA14E